jgi:RHS repeat-associated protein
MLGLYTYGARWYQPSLGRFLQPDTVVPEPGNPQSLNRYTYVYNNPLRYIDPSGHEPDPEAGMQKPGLPTPRTEWWRRYGLGCSSGHGHDVQGGPRKRAYAIGQYGWSIGAPCWQT